MAYIPNATDTAEPVESQTVESAALEFRTLKASVNGRLGSLQAELDAEEVARATGDSNLQAQLGLETAERIGADSGLNVRLSDIEALVAAVGTGPVSSASSVGFQPAGTGAVATTVQSKLRESVSVKDFGAVGDGVTDDTAAFSLADASGKHVLVPQGSYLINGTVILIPGDKTGSANFWLETSIRANSEKLAEHSVISRSGGIGGLFASRSSDNPTPNMQTIGVSSFGVNDNATNPEPSWATYLEAVRYAGAGPSFGMEIDFINLGNTYALDPYSTFSAYSATSAPTSSLWLSCGGGDSGLAVASNPISAAITVLPNSKKFNRGLVFRAGSLTTDEAITVPNGYQIAWYREANTVNSFIDHRQIVQTTSITSSLGNVWNLRKDRGGNASEAIDTVCRVNYSGCTGGFTYSVGAFTQVLQRTNYVGGNARFSYDINVKNADGTNSEVTLNGLADKSFAPTPDSPISLGTSSFRWSVVYAAGLDVTGNILVKSPTGGLGYGTGAGGTVTQATSKSTAVTLNKPCGQITMNNAAMTAGAAVAFLLNNNLFNGSTGDVVICGISGGAVDGTTYSLEAITLAGNAIRFKLINTGAVSLSEALVINFAIIKGTVA